MEGIIQCSANFVPLTPISFLQRAATVYKDKTSIIYGTLQFSWRQTYSRCLKLASALVKLGLSRGDLVVTLAPNVPAHYELHFSVPMAGAVLSTLDTNLDATTLALLLQQLGPILFFFDYQYLHLILQAFHILSTQNIDPPQLVLIPDQHDFPLPKNFKSLSCLDYDSILESVQNNNDNFEVKGPENECDPISVNYTSGSTGIPKGVIYSHRATYFNSLAEIFRFDMRQIPVFLWTVDMFRCNGWCLAWTMAAVGGTNICLRNVSAEVVFDSILLHKVTHLCGPPSLLNIISGDECENRQRIPWKVNVIVAGAFLNPKTVKKVEELGFTVFDGYGMTEVLGPATISQASKVDSHDVEQEKVKAREGLHNIFIEEIDVKDSDTMISVASDGKTMGEVMFRSNTLMSGYLKNPKATENAFRGGWYHTRDVGVKHENGFIQMKDRGNDIISSSKNESISSLEVELLLLNHPKVLQVGVVGKYDDFRKEEVACAFVKLRDGFDANENEIIGFCNGKLPNHMIPKIVVFGEIPVNFNGKVQKFLLREKVNRINKVFPS